MFLTFSYRWDQSSKANKNEVIFLWDYLQRSLLKLKQETRNFYFGARRFDCLKTINLDQNSFDILINVNYRL